MQRLSGFFCPCHNGQFDYNGNALASPVTKPLVIPPFKIQGETIIVGEVGEAYLQLHGGGKSMNLKIHNFNILLYTGAIMVVLCLLLLVSGIFLAMHYIPEEAKRLRACIRPSCKRLTTVGYGVKSTRLARLFSFLLLYIHLLGMLYFGFYKHGKTKYWYSGMVLYFCCMVIGFTGYVLPMGQMS